MSKKIDKVRVNLKERSYDILIGSNILDDLGNHLKKLNLNKSVVIISDTNVDKLYGDRVRKSLIRAGFKTDLFIIFPGEKYKNLDIVSKIFDRLIELKLERNSTIVALGGGVIGDIAGFAAATYLRGINFVQVPTTLLAQVDSSVGGKTGIDHQKGKNLIGAFYQPRLVFIDVNTLSTLKPDDVRSGMAEVIKYGLIRDEEFFKYIKKSKDIINNYKHNKAVAECWKRIVKTSCRIKAWVVSNDEKEKNLRRILNFGHTVGHAIEASQNYEGYTHGEAVSLGMITATKLSRMLNIISKNTESEIIEVIKGYKLPVKAGKISYSRIMESMKLDKKIKDNKINFVLLRKIGSTIIKDNISEKIIKKAINELEHRAQRTEGRSI